MVQYFLYYLFYLNIEGISGSQLGHSGVLLPAGWRNVFNSLSKSSRCLLHKQEENIFNLTECHYLRSLLSLTT